MTSSYDKTREFQEFQESQDFDAIWLSVQHAYQEIPSPLK